jgi:hypothetical protein
MPPDDMQPPANPDLPIVPVASAEDRQGLKATRAAANAAKLSDDEREIFHDLISGQDITDYQELLEIAHSVKAGTW